jgi:hypothetical protein
MSCRRVVLTIVVIISVIVVDGFNLSPQWKAVPRITSDRKQQLLHALKCTTNGDVDGEDIVRSRYNQLERNSRRDFVAAGLALSVTILPVRPEFANAADNASGSLETILLEIQKARQQMNAVPDLIKSEQWDGVRAILITPPLSDLWTKSARKSSLLQDYANVIGNTPSGDELAVLEAKEDVEGHLRFLDMAVYNNNFNPIKSVGEIGATKALISSYYDDPINEYKATVAALDNLIQLGYVK